MTESEPIMKKHWKDSAEKKELKRRRNEEQAIQNNNP